MWDWTPESYRLLTLLSNILFCQTQGQKIQKYTPKNIFSKLGASNIHTLTNFTFSLPINHNLENKHTC